MTGVECKLRRLALGLTQAGLAAAVKLSPAAISRYELGERSISDATAARIEAAVKKERLRQEAACAQRFVSFDWELMGT